MPDERESLRRAIAEFGAAAEPQLADCLNRGDVALRRGAAMAAAGCRYSEALLTPLLDALRDLDPEVRLWAATALGAQGWTQACPALLFRLSDTGPVRAASLTAIQSILDDPAYPSSRPVTVEAMAQWCERWPPFERHAGDEQGGEQGGESLKSQRAYLLRIAATCVSPSRLPQFMEFLDEALRVARESPQTDLARLGIGLGWQLLGLLEAHRSSHLATTVCESMVALALQMSRPDVEWRLWRRQGELYEILKNDVAAFDAYAEGIRVIERLWFAILPMGRDGERRQREYFRDKATLFDAMVLCCLRLERDSLAWEYLEKGKARFLGDLIARCKLPPERRLSRLSSEYWGAIRAARHRYRCEKDDSFLGPPPPAPPTVTVTGVRWEKPPDSRRHRRPQHLAALEDHPGRDALATLTLRAAREIWAMAARIPGAVDEGRIRDVAEVLYRALAPVRQALESSDNATTAVREASAAACELARKRMATLRLGLNERLPEICPTLNSTSYFRDILLPTSQGSLRLLEIRALVEALNAIVWRESIAAGPLEQRKRSAARQPILQVATRPHANIIPHAGTSEIASAPAKLDGSRWDYFAQLVRGQTTSLAAAQEQIRGVANQALVEFCVTEQGTAAFLVLPSSESRSRPMPMRSGGPRLEVVTSAVSLRDIQSLIADARKHWRRDMGSLLQQVYERLLRPIDERLQELNVRRISFVPHRALHVLPLHALFEESGGGRRYLLDDYEISYAPSATIAQIASRRQRSGGKERSLSAMEHPASTIMSGPLPLAPYEMTSVSSHFDPSRRHVVRGREAREGALPRLPGRTHFHFIGHGGHKAKDPLQSSLYLAARDRLTLEKLFDGAIPLVGTRLACLSACESGLTDAADMLDEYLGLSAGFLFSGAQSVVSSLWKVDDTATALLMDRFYKLHMEGQMTPAAALRRSQLWLRDASKDDLCAEVDTRRSLLPSEALELLDAKLDRLRSDLPPFRHPHHWAAFTVASNFGEPAEPG